MIVLLKICGKILGKIYLKAIRVLLMCSSWSGKGRGHAEKRKLNVLVGWQKRGNFWNCGHKLGFQNSSKGWGGDSREGNQSKAWKKNKNGTAMTTAKNAVSRGL